MSIPVPLDVQVSNPLTTKSITRRVAGLSFSSAAYGGYADARIRFAKPLQLGAPEVLPYTDIVVTDGRTGKIVWQGVVEDPGPGVGSSGEVWDVTAMGPSARAADKTLPLIWIETALGGWYPRNRFGGAGRAEIGGTPDTPSTSDEALVLTAPGGAVIGNGIVAAMYYDRLARAHMELGGYGYDRIAGKAAVASDWQNESLVLGDDGTPAAATITSQNWNAVGATTAAKVVTTDFTAGADVLRLNIRRAGGATTIADDVSWGAFYNLYVAARRYLQNGAFETPANHGNAYVLASEIVADMLGRGVLPFDGANATIAATSYHIDQLAYPDGITAREVLEDLVALEPGFFYAAWEGSPARFEWSQWPTQVTYGASVKDGYDAPTSAVELFDEVEVRWRDKNDRVQTDLFTSTVGTLVDAGISRRSLVDLSDNVGSANNAARVGANFLTDHAYPPNAGTITISRPVRNMLTGDWEQPWEIKPGRLIRVDGVEPNPDSLNATGTDGVSVMRIIGTTYDAGSNSVVCELDSYSRALARSLARASARRR